MPLLSEYELSELFLFTLFTSNKIAFTYLHKSAILFLEFAVAMFISKNLVNGFFAIAVAKIYVNKKNNCN